jgi:hypothetical protein
MLVSACLLEARKSLPERCACPCHLPDAHARRTTTYEAEDMVLFVSFY